MAEPSLKIVIREGPGKLPKEKKTKEWAQVLCSESNRGCGTVFWAERSSFYPRKSDRPTALELVESGDFTQCPKCGSEVGGLDVKFVKMDCPDPQARARCVTCNTNFHSVQCSECVLKSAKTKTTHKDGGPCD